MNKLIDRLTQFINAALSILLIGHPNRTALGVVLGVTASTLNKIFAPILARASSIIDLSKVSVYEFLFIGIALMHIPTFGFYFKRKGSYLSENEEKAFEIIREARKMGVNAWQVGDMYLKLCEKVLTNVEINQSTQTEIKQLLNQSK